MRALARALVGERALADDVVQETWLAALDRPPRLQRGFAAWARAVVRHRAHDHHARQRRARQIEALVATDSLSESPGGAAAYAQAERDESRAALRRAVARLASPYREVIELRYLEERALEDVCRALGRRPSTVRSQVTRGIAELRRMLDGDRAPRGLWSACTAPFARWSASASSPGRGPRAGGQARPAAARAAAACAALIVVAGLAVSVLARAGRDAAPADASVGARDAPARASAGSALGPAPRAAPRRSAPADVGDGARSVAADARFERVAETVAQGTADRAALQPDATPPRSLTLDVVREDGLPATDLTVTFTLAGAPERTVRAARSPVCLDLDDGAPVADRPTGARAVVVSVVAAGEARSKEATIQVPPEGRRAELRTRGPARRVTLRVVDSGGAPLGGVEAVLAAIGGQARTALAPGVSAKDPAQRARTDADGRAVFSDVALRARRLTVDAPGCAPVERFLDGADGARDLDLDVVVALTPGLVLRGEVRRPDGAPAAGALIEVRSGLEVGRGASVRSARASASGAYELRGVSPHRQHVFASYTDATGQRCTDAGLVSGRGAQPGAEGLRWDAHPQPGRGLRVVLRDAAGEPLAARSVLVVVEAEPGTPYFRRVAPTDARGEVEFDPVPNAPCDVYVERGLDDMLRVARQVTARGVDLAWTVPAGPTLFGAVGGRVLARAAGPTPGGVSGAAPHGAVVTGQRDGEVFSADVDAHSGVWSAAGLSAGDYELHLAVPGRGLVALGPRTIAPGRTLDCGVCLTPALQRVTLADVVPGWAAARPDAKHSWVVEASPPAGSRQWVPVRSLTGATPQLALFPGRYRLVDEVTGACSPTFECGAR